MFSASGHPTSWCDLGRGKRTGQEDVSTAAKVWVGHVVERPLPPMPPAAPSPHHQAPPPLFLAPKHTLREHIPNYLVEAVGRKRSGALGGVEGWARRGVEVGAVFDKHFWPHIVCLLHPGAPPTTTPSCSSCPSGCLTGSGACQTSMHLVGWSSSSSGRLVSMCGR